MDIYEPLTTEWCYDKAVSPVQAIPIMREGVERGWWGLTSVEMELLILETAALAENPKQSIGD